MSPSRDVHWEGYSAVAAVGGHRGLRPAALALGGQLDRALAVFERAAAYANDLGLLAEEVDGVNGELLGNFPQALSHVGLVNAAWAITQAQAGRAAPATEPLR